MGSVTDGEECVLGSGQILALRLGQLTFYFLITKCE